MLNLLKEHDLYLAKYNFKGTSLDELSFVKDEIIIASKNVIENWTQGFANNHCGWFPVTTSKLIELHGSKQNSTSQKTNDGQNSSSLPEVSKDMMQQKADNYSSIINCLLLTEKDYILNYVNSYKAILKIIREHKKLQSREVNRIVGTCKQFFVPYKRLLSNLEAEISKPLKNQEIGECYITFFNQLRYLAMFYCEKHPFFIQPIIKLQKDFDTHLRTELKNSNTKIMKYFSMPFMRIEQLTTLLQELADHSKDVNLHHEEIKIAASLFQLLSGCCNEIRKRSIELSEVTIDPKSQSELSGQLYYAVQGFLTTVNNKKIERYILLYPSQLALMRSVDDEKTLKPEKIFPLNEIRVEDLQNSVSMANGIEISSTVEDSFDSILITLLSAEDKNYFFSVFNQLLKTNKYTPFWEKELTEMERSKSDPQTVPRNDAASPFLKKATDQNTRSQSTNNTNNNTNINNNHSRQSDRNPSIQTHQNDFYDQNNAINAGLKTSNHSSAMNSTSSGSKDGGNQIATTTNYSPTPSNNSNYGSSSDLSASSNLLEARVKLLEKKVSGLLVELDNVRIELEFNKRQFEDYVNSRR